jgi:tetratricopeptide (TPR) repeat protein
MQTGLAEAWWARVRGAGEESDLLSAAQNLGHSLVHAGKYTEAEQMFREVHGIGMRLLGPAHPKTMDSACEIAACLLRQGKYAQAEGKYAQAEQLNRQVLAFYTRVLGPEDQTTLVSANNLASCLNGRLKHAEAEQICREVLAVRKRVLGLEHRDTLTSAGNLTSYLSNQGRHAEAEQLKREVLAARKRVLGPEHPETLTSASNVASSLASQGKHAEAEPIEREVLAARKRVLGPEHPDTLQAATHLACSLFHQSKNVEGVAKLAAQIYNFYSKVAPDRLTDTDADPVQPTGLAEEYVDKQDLLNERLCGRYGVDLVTLSEQVPAEAAPLHIATNAAHGTDDLPGGVPASEGGDVTKDLEKQKKAMEAQQLFEDTLEAQQRVLGPAHPDTLHTAGLLEDVRARIRAAPPTIAAAPAATGAARPLLLCALPPDGIAAAAGGGGSTDAQARRPSTQHKHAQARTARERERQ